ncbi:MAG: hypothetical protein PHU95_05715 [Candidatus Thermoplasmatota archaeon]|nr:hypothetical protein [Candidatus Thermoplasmatota archaeon]MDD5778924.1 hypothetical protein [Candidatus Thermoplasmatota archaeon]
MIKTKPNTGYEETGILQFYDEDDHERYEKLYHEMIISRNKAERVSPVKELKIMFIAISFIIGAALQIIGIGL